MAYAHFDTGNIELARRDLEQELGLYTFAFSDAILLGSKLDGPGLRNLAGHAYFSSRER